MKNLLTGQNIRPPAKAPGAKNKKPANKSGLTKRPLDGAYPCDCFVNYGIDYAGKCKMCGGTPRRFKASWLEAR